MAVRKKRIFLAGVVLVAVPDRFPAAVENAAALVEGLAESGWGGTSGLTVYQFDRVGPAGTAWVSRFPYKDNRRAVSRAFMGAGLLSPEERAALVCASGTITLEGVGDSTQGNELKDLRNRLKPAGSALERVLDEMEPAVRAARAHWYTPALQKIAEARLQYQRGEIELREFASVVDAHAPRPLDGVLFPHLTALRRVDSIAADLKVMSTQREGMGRPPAGPPPGNGSDNSAMSLPMDRNESGGRTSSSAKVLRPPSAMGPPPNLGAVYLEARTATEARILWDEADRLFSWAASLSRLNKEGTRLVALEDRLAAERLYWTLEMNPSVAVRYKRMSAADWKKAAATLEALTRGNRGIRPEVDTSFLTEGDTMVRFYERAQGLGHAAVVRVRLAMSAARVVRAVLVLPKNQIPSAEEALRASEFDLAVIEPSLRRWDGVDKSLKLILEGPKPPPGLRWPPSAGPGLDVVEQFIVALLVDKLTVLTESLHSDELALVYVLQKFTRACRAAGRPLDILRLETHRRGEKLFLAASGRIGRKEFTVVRSLDKKAELMFVDKTWIKRFPPVESFEGRIRPLSRPLASLRGPLGEARDSAASGMTKVKGVVTDRSAWRRGVTNVKKTPRSVAWWARNEWVQVRQRANGPMAHFLPITQAGAARGVKGIHLALRPVLFKSSETATVRWFVPGVGFQPVAPLVWRETQAFPGRGSLERRAAQYAVAAMTLSPDVFSLRLSPGSPAATESWKAGALRARALARVWAGVSTPGVLRWDFWRSPRIPRWDRAVLPWRVSPFDAVPAVARPAARRLTPAWGRLTAEALVSRLGKWTQQKTLFVSAAVWWEILHGHPERVGDWIVGGTEFNRRTRPPKTLETC